MAPPDPGPGPPPNSARSPDPPPDPPERPGAPWGPDRPPWGEIDGYGPVSPATIERLLCDADICRIVTRGDSEVLDVGMTHRLATAAQRRAIRVRSGGHCEFGECDVPFDHCEIHHTTPFNARAGTGPTDLDSLAAGCVNHHHLVHGGYTLRRTATGFDLIRPDGTPITTPKTTRTPRP